MRGADLAGLVLLSIACIGVGRYGCGGCDRVNVEPTVQADTQPVTPADRKGIWDMYRRADAALKWVETIEAKVRQDGKIHVDVDVPLPVPNKRQDGPLPMELEKQAAVAPSPLTVDTRLRMVILRNPAQCDLRPLAYRLGQKGYDVVLADVRKPANKEWLITHPVARTPCYTIWRGHEAVEATEGSLSEVEAVAWLRRVKAGESSSGRFYKPPWQDKLKEIDRVYLTQRMTPGSCGMLGCGMHGGGLITEYVTKPLGSGSATKPVAKQTVVARVDADSCDSGGGGCRGGCCGGLFRRGR